MTNEPCPIWGTPAQRLPTTRDGFYFDSMRAGGRYFVAGSAQPKLDRQDSYFRARLTSWLIDQHRFGVECPEIMTPTLNEIEARRPLPVQQRADRLLRALSELQRHIGDPIAVEVATPAERIYGQGHTPLGGFLMAHTESIELREVGFLLDQLERMGFLQVVPSDLPEPEYVIPVEGLEHLAQMEAAATDSKQAFVAMWFDASMQSVYAEGIAPAISDAGYVPLRIDGKEHNNKIDDEIIAEIRRSRFLVADFTQGETGARGGVYYEAGFAHGLSIPVIFTCRQDVIDRAHFDTRQYNHITWETPQDLRERLAQRISATIGDGPLRERK